MSGPPVAEQPQARLRARRDARLERARALLADARRLRPRPLASDAALCREARRLRPVLEAIAGRPYGRLPALGFRGRWESRIAGPWSQYLTLGLGVTRLVRMASAAEVRLAAPTVLAHELAHRYAFDETLTTLRGLEASARLAEAGDVRHGAAVRIELARALWVAAMVDALRAGAPGPLEAALPAGAEAEPGLARARTHWEGLRRRGRRPAPWSAVVYALLPVASLEAAAAAGEDRAAPPPFPRFPLDSPHAAVCLTYTAADALAGRRRARVPVGATLRLLAATGTPLGEAASASLAEPAEATMFRARPTGPS